MKCAGNVWSVDTHDLVFLLHHCRWWAWDGGIRNWGSDLTSSFDLVQYIENLAFHSIYSIYFKTLIWFSFICKFPVWFLLFSVDFQRENKKSEQHENLPCASDCLFPIQLSSWLTDLHAFALVMNTHAPNRTHRARNSERRKHPVRVADKKTQKMSKSNSFHFPKKRKKKFPEKKPIERGLNDRWIIIQISRVEKKKKRKSAFAVAVRCLFTHSVGLVECLCCATTRQEKRRTWMPKGCCYTTSGQLFIPSSGARTTPEKQHATHRESISVQSLPIFFAFGRCINSIRFILFLGR